MKNGSDAIHRAENGSDANDNVKFCANTIHLQLMMQSLYEFSTKLDTDERGDNGLARMIGSNPPNPLNSRSILQWRRKKKRQCRIWCRNDAEKWHRCLGGILRQCSWRKHKNVRKEQCNIVTTTVPR